MNIEVDRSAVFTPAVSDFMSTFRAFHEHGVLPNDGGFLDQPATWCDAEAIVTEELALIESEREAERDRARKAAAKGR